MYTFADYGSMERYEFQLLKSVILKIDLPADDEDCEDNICTLIGEPMPVITECMHVGILRSAHNGGDSCGREYQKG